MAEIFDWSTTDGSNTQFPENMAYSLVNDRARAALGAAARLYADNDGSLTSGGTLNAYTLTTNVQYTAYTDMPIITFVAGAANTGACTLAVNALAAKDLRDAQGAALQVGAIDAGQIVSVRYDSANGYFRCLGLISSTSGVHNVMDYGATGDGTTLDDDAFQDALAAAAVSLRPVYIPGTDASYRLSETLELHNKAIVFGDGPTSKILWAGGNYPVFARSGYTNRSTGGVDDVVLRNLEIDDFTVTTARTSEWTIDLTNGTRHTIDGVTVYGKLTATNTDLFGLLIGKHPDGVYIADPDGIVTSTTASGALTLDGAYVSGGVADLTSIGGRKITVKSTGNASNITVTIDGTDIDGAAASVVLTGPNATTVRTATTTFATVTGVTTSGTPGAAIQVGVAAGDVWLNQIINSRFSRCKVYVNSTDNYLTTCSFYGLGRDYALRLIGGNVVSGCNFIGGNVYGSIYICDPELDVAFAIKVNGCQFDGNNSYDTKYGIYAPPTQLVRSCTITANHLWNHNNEFVRIEQGSCIVVANNAFRQGDADDTGEPDVFIIGDGCVIGPNSHYRSSTYPKAGGGTRVNVSYPVVVQDYSVGGNQVISGAAADLSEDYLSKSFQHDPLVNDMARVRLRDDFLGFTVSGLWAAHKGTSDACSLPAITQELNGAVAFVLGNTSTSTMALNGVVMVGGKVWQCNNDPLYFEARVKASSVANLSLFVGFTDQTDTLEMPITLSGTTLTRNADDCVGFLFDTAADADYWHCVGHKTAGDPDNDPDPIETAVAPVAATYTTLRLELSNAGHAKFWIDGTYVGQILNAVTASLVIAPVIAAWPRTAASKTITVDYIDISQSREL